MDSELTLIFGFRNRELERVKRCFNSLAKQSVQNFKVLFIDYGSDLLLANEVKNLVNSYTFCDYIYTDTRGKPWNRSHALNIGIKRAVSDYVLTTDIDMIYPHKFIEVFLEHARPDMDTHIFHHHLPKDFSDWENIENYGSNDLKPDSRAALGACQMVKTSVLHELRGFDERFCFWGLEDFDMNHRLKLYGLSEQWLEQKTIMYHQWHRSGNWHDIMNHKMPVGHWFRMMRHRYINLDQKIRNENGWGEITESDDRPVLPILKDLDSKIREGMVTYFNKPPQLNKSAGDLFKTFMKMESKYIAIDNAGYPKADKFADRLIKWGNKTLKFLGHSKNLSHPKNILHACVFELIYENPELIDDYYMNYPIGNGITLIRKREF